MNLNITDITRHERRRLIAGFALRTALAATVLAGIGFASSGTAFAGNDLDDDSNGKKGQV